MGGKIKEDSTTVCVCRLATGGDVKGQKKSSLWAHFLSHVAFFLLFFLGFEWLPFMVGEVTMASSSRPLVRQFLVA